MKLVSQGSPLDFFPGPRRLDCIALNELEGASDAFRQRIQGFKDLKIQRFKDSKITTVASPAFAALLRGAPSVGEMIS